MTGVSGKTRVLIATTKGSVEVLRITEEDAAIGRSVVCIDGTTETAAISNSYNAFVASPTGIISRFFGPCCYRLDISAAVDAGTSWQLGVFTAHALHAAGRLAREGEPARAVVLATGPIRTIDLAVREAEHVACKVDTAIGTLSSARHEGSETLVVVPLINIPEVPAELKDKIAGMGARIVGVGTIDDLGSMFGVDLFKSQSQNATKSRFLRDTKVARAVGRHWKTAAMVAIAGLAGWEGAKYHLTPSVTIAPPEALSGEFDGVWEMSGEALQGCPIKTWTHQFLVNKGLIPGSRPERGYVRTGGEFRITFPSRANPSRVNEFYGKLRGDAGQGEYRTLGYDCIGTLKLMRLKL